MLARGTFLELLAGSLLAGPASVAPSPSPSPNPWDECDRSPLPYDRPLGITMETLDGPPFDLVKERGKIVVMNVFATWCPPCRSEQPGFVTAAHRYVERGVSVVGVNDREADDAVRAYRKQFSIDYPIAMDRKGILTWNLEVDNRSRAVLLPVTFFLLRSGQLSCYKRGWMSDEELSYRIEAMLSDDDVAPSPTPK